MYIFGYGSLINSASRLLTGQTGNAYPATVSGFNRHWSKVDTSYKISPLVATSGKGTVNGVLIEIDATELSRFDKREAGYQRMLIPTSQLDSEHPFNTGVDVWIYVKEHTLPPCREIPIMQSYVDTVLAGCLSISLQFTEHFMLSTLGWDHPIENDRLHPKYGRFTGIQDHQISVIDNLIAAKRRSQSS